MSDVASLALCKELYEVSGWDNKDDNPYEIKHYWVDYGKRNGFNVQVTNHIDWQDSVAEYPAYTAGYLLRKFAPTKVSLESYNDNSFWIATLPKLVITATPDLMEEPTPQKMP